MKRFSAMAMVLAALAFGAVVLRRSPRGPTVRERPECADAATCGPAATAPPPKSVRAEPAAAATAPPWNRGETRAVQPSPAVAADGAALRAEADRLIADGKVIEGIAVFRKAVEVAPTAKNHGDFGALLYRLTAFDEAALHLRAAAELDPGDADRWIALANVYYRKVDPGAAWKAEKRARAAEPGLELGRDAAGMRVRKGDTVPRNPEAAVPDPPR
jgi:Flp pilus assembly protein TadD